MNATITPAHVRAGIEREMRALAAIGRVGPAARLVAIAITRSKIVNSPLLAERQVSASRCHVCGGPERAGEPFVPVLSPGPGSVHWVHIHCHGEHVRRVVMEAAGYGVDDLRGAA